MATSSSKLSFDDCYEAFERAISATKGIRLTFTDYGSANYFKNRLHMARQLDRKANAETYEQDHPSHGTTKYDELYVKLLDMGGKGIVLIEKIKLNAEIEEIE